MSKISKLCKALEGEGRDGFAVYHVAKRIRDGQRCKDPMKRLGVARKALAMTSVCAWIVDGKVQLRRGAQILITL